MKIKIDFSKLDKKKLLLKSARILAYVMGAMILLFLIALPFPRTQFQLLRARYRNMEPRIKIRYYKKFVERHPRYIPSRLKLAAYYAGEYYTWKGDLSAEETGYLDSTIEQYSKVIELDPGNEEAISGLNNIYMAEKEYEKSLALNSKLIELDPENTSSRINLAYLYFTQNENDKALEELKTAIEMDPENARAYMLAATIHQVEKDIPTAINDYKQAIEVFESQEKFQGAASACQSLGALFLEARLPYNAVEQFEKAVELFPGSISMRFALAEVYARAGLSDKCISTLEDSPLYTSLDSSDKISPQMKVRAYVLLYQAAFNKRDFMAAMTYLKKAEAFGAQFPQEFMTRVEDLAKKQREDLYKKSEQAGNR